MFRIGAHVSISDGFAAAVEHEQELDGTCGQVFVGSPRGWNVPEVDQDEAATFEDAVQELDVRPWIVHGTYLINLATPKDDLAQKSVQCVQDEIDACDALSIPYYTFHPGAHTGAGREQGIANVADRLSQLDIPDGVTLLLENTAGKGTTVGKTFAALDAMVHQSEYGYDDIGICLDSCHLYAAGHDFTTAEGIDEMLAEIDSEIGTDNVHYLHLNDSKHPLGSEKDEHEHLGEGEIGEHGFELFINHDALRDIPMVVETPEDSKKGFAWNIAKAKEVRE
ncbi:MAG: deoxyribonuclease IV [Candidatus Nanohaloarchaea archaeon]|nr:deoxyribonuclease IV [Candidatus Nanohaloarchaea archaeon]